MSYMQLAPNYETTHLHCRCSRQRPVQRSDEFLGTDPTWHPLIAGDALTTPGYTKAGIPQNTDHHWLSWSRLRASLRHQRWAIFCESLLPLAPSTAISAFDSYRYCKEAMLQLADNNAFSFRLHQQLTSVIYHN